MQRRDGAVSAKNEAVAEAFARYYELYEKYGMDYDVTGNFERKCDNGGARCTKKSVGWQCRLRSTSG